jgi:glucokinase
MDLIADIGATNTRCALVDEHGRVGSIERFENVDFASLQPLLDAYLARHCASERPRRAALAVAAPIVADDIEMININWRFAQSKLKANLDLERLTIVNDFAALAWALPGLGPKDYRQIDDGTPVPRATLAVIGPGSGLGVASLTPTPDGWTAVSGEGGHVTLAVTTPEEAEVVDSIRDESGHCSAERVLSGPGLVRLYGVLAKRAGRGAITLEPAEVTMLAEQGDALARKAFTMFFTFLGTVAGNLALTVGARGGVFIGGGIVPRVLDAFAASPFRARFMAKGRYQTYLESIPTYAITEPLPAFRGLQRLLGYRGSGRNG